MQKKLTIMLVVILCVVSFQGFFLAYSKTNDIKEETDKKFVERKAIDLLEPVIDSSAKPIDLLEPVIDTKIKAIDLLEPYGY